MTNSADPDQLASSPKPTDLDLCCLLRQGMSYLAREVLNERICSDGERLIPFKGRPFSGWKKINFDSCTCIYSIPINISQQADSVETTSIMFQRCVRAGISS